MRTTTFFKSLLLLTPLLLLSACQAAGQPDPLPIPAAESIVEIPTRVVEALVPDEVISDGETGEPGEEEMGDDPESQAESTVVATPTPLSEETIEEESAESEASDIAPSPDLPAASPEAVPSETAPPVPTSVPTVTPTIDPSAQFDTSALRIYNFEENRELIRWIIVNDSVMGGVSYSTGILDDGNVLFQGELSLDNNGGFASIRGPIIPNLSEFSGLRMRVRGDGRSYYLRLRDVYGGNGLAHEELFVTSDEEWVIVEIPFADLAPVVRGFDVDRPSLDPSQLVSIGFMLREKEEGPFKLEIDWIEAYGRDEVAMLSE
ncbi:MAG: CIA30 family protein [Chloroflexota bacterium]